MKTAEIRANEIFDAIANHYSSIDDVKSQIIEYAKEAIKADRENVAEHAICTTKDISGGGLDFPLMFVVDKDSIINAPNIELL